MSFIKKSRPKALGLSNKIGLRGSKLASKAWIKAIPPSTSHGTGTLQKRLWRLVSDFVRIRDWYKYGTCVATGVKIENWRSGDAGHTARPLVVDANQHEATTLKNGAQIVMLGDGIDGSLTPTQKLVHEQSRAHGWSPEEQDALHATMKTRNVLLQRKVSRLIRSIGAALKANKDTDKEYAMLKKLLKEPKDPPMITASVFCFGSACE